jgi:hypothetical protein
MIQSLFTIDSLISLAIFKLNLTILEKITVRTWYFKQILFHSKRFKETFFSIDQYVNISVEQKSKSDLYGRIKFRYFPFFNRNFHILYCITNEYESDAIYLEFHIFMLLSNRTLINN